MERAWGEACYVQAHLRPASLVGLSVCESRTPPGLVHLRSPALSTEQVEVCTGVLV